MNAIFTQMSIGVTEISHTHTHTSLFIIVYTILDVAALHSAQNLQ